ncbi:MAG: sensor histidine kinase [Oscillospiraceae bacterium]
MRALTAWLRRIPFAVALAAAIAVSALFFLLCWRYDNKYTAPRPQAEEDYTHLNMSWYDGNPLFYLLDGWEIYLNRQLTPEELAETERDGSSLYSPDEYVFIGQYGGFDLGDPDKPPRGEATYRTRIITDATEREYALELTDIYTSWQLWVNGRLVQVGGERQEGEDFPRPDSRMVTFRASGTIEIVVAVSDDRGFYSGMMYPPAFGSPERVGRVSSLRLLVHAASGAVAVFIGLLCLLMANWRRQYRPTLALTALCICYAGSTAWPLLQAAGLGGSFWTVVEQACYYGIFLALIWIQGRLCKLPNAAFIPALTAGGLVCAGVVLLPLLPVTRAGSLMLVSNLFSAYKWLAAAWLIGTSAWALWQGKRYTKVLLAGSCIFATALICSKVLPLYEPIVGGWFVEQAGFVLILLVAGILWRDTVRVYRDSLLMQEQKRMADLQLEVRSRYAAFQQEYVTATRERLHETRNVFTLLRHYMEEGRLDALRSKLDAELPGNGRIGSGQYTGNTLVDAILSLQLARLEENAVYLETDLHPLPEQLGLADEDITSLLMNLLDNVAEACGRIPNEDSRWMYLQMELREKQLKVVCENALPEGEIPPEGGTVKADARAHGFGLSLIRKIADRYGSMEVERGEDSYRVTILLALPDMK